MVILMLLHWKSDCSKLKEKKRKSDNTSNVDDSVSITEIVLMVPMSSQHAWILDSMYSYHLYPHQDWFFSCHLIDGGIVFIENNISYKNVGIRTIQIKMHYGIVKILSDLRHILDLRKNLICLSTLDSYGFKYSDEGQVLKVSKGALIVLKDSLSHGLYLLQDSIYSS